MPKFAHMSDIHLGAFRQPELRALVNEAFEAALDRCVAEQVDFLVLSGDIFDSNIPDLSSVRRAARKMKELVDRGIRIYAIYGSHDFSPNYSSIIDVLDGAGLFVKAEMMAKQQDKVHLSMVEDPTGVRIAGISGRKLSIDRDEFAALDRTELEAEPGPKVFVFHGALDELKPSSLQMMQSMPASYLPSGFMYYAGGHVHSRSLTSLPGRANIAYPGPLFATDYVELLQMARGEARGFYMVEFEDGRVSEVEFAPVKVCDVVELHYSAEGRSASRVANDLAQLASVRDKAGKVVLLTVDGELSEGKTSDIDFPTIRRRLLAGAPLSVLSNYSQLTSKEMAKSYKPQTPGKTNEREVFSKELAGVKTEESKLQGESGVDIALALLTTLKEGRKENENKGDFEDRTSKAGLGVLGIAEGD